MKIRHLPLLITRIGIAAVVVTAPSCLSSPSGRGHDGAPGRALILPEHYAHSIAALGMPGARRAFQVGHGSVVASGDAALEWRLGSGADSVQVSPVYFEQDGVPVAHWWMLSARESVHFEAAAVQSEALGDTSLPLSVRATVTWRAREPGESALEVQVAARPEGPNAVPWDAEDALDFEEFWRGHSAFRNGRLVAGVDPRMTIALDAPRPGRPAITRGHGPGALRAIGSARLAPGEQHSWHFWMPIYPIHPPGRAIERSARHDAVVGEARGYWRQRLAEGARLATPDSLVNAAWRAALVTLLVSHERELGEWVPIGNPFQYRDVWLRDAARVVRALAVVGYTEMARSDVRTLRRFQLPTGVLLSQRGQLDGTGQWLWAAAQAANLPPSPSWAKELIPTVGAALEWIEVQRSLLRQLKTSFPSLLPYADPRDNELVRAQLVGNDAWGIAGCRAAATLARLAGHDSLSRAADSAASDYRAAFLAALARSAGPDIPPSWQGVGRDWGNLAVGYPTQVLAANDPRLASLARRVWSRTGGPGLASHAPLDTLHSYVGADLAQWALLADRPAEARRYLAGMIAHSSSTLGQAEVFNREARTFGSNLPPHATAAAVLVDLVRNMMVSDTRDTLELALAGDPAWWHGTRFERAVTRFGVIDVTLDSPAGDRRRARWGAVAVPTRVRVADGERVVEVLTPGTRAVDGRWIECPPQTRGVEFRIEVALTTLSQVGPDRPKAP